LRAGPAAARRPAVEQIGRGTWATADPGLTFSGTTEGLPFSGDTVGSITPDDGQMPPPMGGCVPGSGTATTESGSLRLTLAFSGKMCSMVAPTGHIVFLGWYDVVEYSGAKGKRVASGRGSVDIRSFTDGTIQWMIDGDLY
jgi:hypothetical protein